MNRKLFWNVTASVVVLFFGVLSYATGSYATGEKTAAQGRNLLENGDMGGFFTIDANDKKHALLFFETEETRKKHLVNNPEHELPVLVLFYAQPRLLHFERPPRMYLAI